MCRPWRSAPAKRGACAGGVYALHTWIDGKDKPFGEFSENFIRSGPRIVFPREKLYDNKTATVGRRNPLGYTIAVPEP